MTTRQLLALTAILLISSSQLRAENLNQLNWASNKIQLSVQRDKSDAAIPSGISIRNGTREIAVIGDDHLVRIKNRDSGKLVRVFDTHSDWGKIALFHPDGKTLFTAGSDHTIMRWNAENEHDFQRFAIETRAIEGMAIDSSGKYLATVGFDQRLNVYEIGTRKRLHQIKCPCSDMRAIAFSPDSRLIACGGRNGKVRILNVASGEQVADITAHAKRIRDLTFVDHNRLVTCSDDRTVKSINLTTRSADLILDAPAKFYSLASLGGSRVAVGCSDNLIRIVDLNQKSGIGYLKGHTGTVCELVFDGKNLFSGSFDTSIRVWEVDAAFISAPAVRISQRFPKQPIPNSQPEARTPQHQISNKPPVSTIVTKQDSVIGKPSSLPAATKSIATQKAELPTSKTFQPNSTFVIPTSKPTTAKPKASDRSFSNSGFQIAK